MTIDSHISDVRGKPVELFDLNETKEIKLDVVYRIASDVYADDENMNWKNHFMQFCNLAKGKDVKELIIGCYEEPFEVPSEEIAAMIMEAVLYFPNLEYLFFLDIVGEENEISWINNTLVTPLIKVFPKLTYFGVRGGNGLSLSGIEHPNLETLVIQTGGLDRRVIHELVAGKLPKLSHLEIYTGSDNYGANIQVEDLMPIIFGKAFPNLTYLGLKNSEIADGIAKAVAASPFLEKLEVLDTSLGLLTDEGVEPLLNAPSFAKLKKFDCHHHYLSEKMMKKLENFAKTYGIEIDLTEKQNEDEYKGEVYRYIAISE